MILGAHESAAGGCHHVFERCARDGAHAVQIWTRSSRQWASKPLQPDDVRAFKQAHAAYAKPKIPTAAHASYLINLAARAPAIRERSTATLLEECRRAETLGVGQVVVHPGAAQDAPVEEGLARVARALQRICRALGPKPRVRLLIEFTAGQGSCVGCSFEQLDAILQKAGERRLGVCLDTQHMFAAGVEWTTPRGYERTFEEFDRVVGLRHLEAFHLNDSKRPLGARVDRHEVIGEGHIGLEPFGRLVRDPRFAAVPGYLETPPLANGDESYALGLQRLRSLL
ncbi:MAG TPA: deoxyribonuclease IV [Polyangia bacterium]|nr:deoxyribonuclease IV [Polyangia bacterium]